MYYFIRPYYKSILLTPSLKKEVIGADCTLLSDSSKQPSQQHVQVIAACGWPKEYVGPCPGEAICCSLDLLKLLSLHVHSDNQCPVKYCK